MWEDFINALNNFVRNKTRTFLSLLGVIIGVASVIVITSIGSSSTKQVADTFGSAGLDMVSISSGGMCLTFIPLQLLLYANHQNLQYCICTICF